LTTTVGELQWFAFLLRYLKIDTGIPANLYCDNQAGRHIAVNPVFHKRTKHIDIDCHVIREELQAELFHLLPIKGSEQPADIFTKALYQPTFNLAICKFRMMDPSSSLRRGC